MADSSKTVPTLAVEGVSQDDRKDFQRSVEILSKSELVKTLSNKGARVIVMPDVLEQRVPGVRPEDLEKPLPLVAPIPALALSPGYHPRRRLQIAGAAAAISAISLVSQPDSMATPRVQQMLERLAAKANNPSRAAKKRRKDRKRQRQARKKNR